MITLTANEQTYTSQNAEGIARAIELTAPNAPHQALVMRVWADELDEDDPIGSDHWEYWDGQIDFSPNAPTITDELLTEYAAWAHHTRPEEVTITRD